MAGKFNFAIMKKKTKINSPLKVVPIVFMTILLIGIGFVCYVFYRLVERAASDQKRYPDPIAIFEYSELKSYSFDPETILAALKQGESNVFQPLPVDAYFDNDDVYGPGSFSWQQQDFLMVSSALYQFVRNDTLKNWRLHAWMFSRDCAGGRIGFDDARVSYFNPNREEHTTIEIDLLNKTASWGVNQHFDSEALFGGWQSLDPTQIKITADDALKIAEMHGGSESRQAFQDQNCSISVRLFAERNVWEVDYYYPSLQVNVDPYSGNYEIIVFPALSGESK